MWPTRRNREHPVKSRELPEPLNCNRTHPVWPTGRAPASGPFWTNTYAPRHHDLALNSDCSAFGHRYDLESGHLVNSAAPSQNTGRVRYEYWTRPVMSGRYRMCPILTLDTSCHPVTSAFNSFSTLSSLPLLKCANHQVYHLVHMC